MKNSRSAGPAPGAFCAATVFFALALASCASAPGRPADPLLEPRIPLDPGAMTYVFIDVPEARPILDHVNIGGYSSAQIGEILDKTSFAVAALYSPESGRGIRAVAWGDYPKTRAGMAFSMSKEWKRRRSAAGKFYWYSSAHRLSLALGSDQAFAAVAPAAARGAVPGTAEAAAQDAWEAVELAAGPFVQGPGIEIPEGFNTFRAGSCLALWMENPAGPLDRFLSALRIPLRIPAEQLMAGFLELPPDIQAPGAVFGAAAPDPAGTLYEIKLRIKVPSETNARTLMTLFSTARIFISRAGNQGGTDQEMFELLSLLFTRPLEQEGAFLTLRSPPLDEEGIALLFNLFSVYSQGKLATE